MPQLGAFRKMVYSMHSPFEQAAQASTCWLVRGPGVRKKSRIGRTHAGEQRCLHYRRGNTRAEARRVNNPRWCRGEKRGPACHRSPSAEPRTEETVKNLCRPHPQTRARLRPGNGPDSRTLKFEPWKLRRNVFLSAHTICTSTRKVCLQLGHGCTQVWKRCEFAVQITAVIA